MDTDEATPVESADRGPIIATYGVDLTFRNPEGANVQPLTIDQLTEVLEGAFAGTGMAVNVTRARRTD